MVLSVMEKINRFRSHRVPVGAELFHRVEMGD